MEIDLIRLAQSAGARVIIGEVTGLDQENRQLLFRSRPPLAFDIMSIGIGSRPTFSGVEIADDAPLLAVKPMQTFLGRLESRLNELRSTTSNPKITVVGGGVGSIEIAFCLYERFFGKPKHQESSWPTDLQPEIALVTRGAEVGSGLLDSTVNKTRREFEKRNIGVHTGATVASVDKDGLVLATGERINSDVVIWATGAVAGPLLGKLGLETDERGFLLTKDNLEVTKMSGVFAVGDTGTMVGSKLSKAGVYAVRQGPILHKNILRKINGSDNLLPFKPQSDFLKLINLGNDRTIAEFKGRSFLGGWCWKVKDRIDVKFMRMYQDYKPMKMTVDLSDDDEPMRCLGCGGKIGGEILSSVLKELQIDDHPDVKIGLNNPDDAAVIATKNNEVTVTTDFFASPFDDPYLAGRIAVLNSASDCFVMGAKPTAALAIVQVPTGHPRAQTQVMREVMTGSVEEFNRMGAAIVGGHSIEGPRMMIGYTVLGQQITDPKTKGNLQPGDQLILTKPLGTGVLLAGWMQCQMPAVCFQPLMDAMLKSNEIALELVEKFPVSAMTDVTGFGFIGHLIELMLASKTSVNLDVASIPVLPGCREMIAAGIESTLAPDNRSLSGKIDFENLDTNAKSVGPLFDPQTSGGLLFGIRSELTDQVVTFLQEHGFEETTVVGECIGTEEKITLRGGN